MSSFIFINWAANGIIINKSNFYFSNKEKKTLYEIITSYGVRSFSYYFFYYIFWSTMCQYYPVFYLKTLREDTGSLIKNPIFKQ